MSKFRPVLIIDNVIFSTFLRDSRGMRATFLYDRSRDIIRTDIRKAEMNFGLCLSALVPECVDLTLF